MAEVEVTINEYEACSTSPAHRQASGDQQAAVTTDDKRPVCIGDDDAEQLRELAGLRRQGGFVALADAGGAASVVNGNPA